MASKSRQKRSDLVIFGSLFVAGLLGKVESRDNNEFLRTRVGDGALEQISSLEGLWDSVAATAQLNSDSLHAFNEYERGMQGMSMSLPLEPTKSPTPSPTDTPTTNIVFPPDPTSLPTPSPIGTPTSSPGTTGTPEPSVITSLGPTLDLPTRPTTTRPTRSPIASPGPTLAPALPNQPTTPGPTSNLVTSQPTPSSVSPQPTRRPAPQPTQAPLPTPRPTLGPTVNCNEDPEGYILGLLTPITDEAILIDPTTPQGMAYQFLIDDEYMDDPCEKKVEQRYGLATLFYSTNGNSWTNNQGWLEPVDECQWAGVTCDENGFVVELALAINNLDGEIPNEILTLVGLKELDVFANAIRGTIPDGFSQLVNLEVLDMQENLLVGQAFPSSILELRRLESYRINNNALTGPVPSRIGSLRALQELWAAGNKIDGSLPTEIGNLRDLKTVLLYENSMKGALPSELGLIPLEGLWLWGNFFQDTIPSQLFNVASLKTFRLEDNFFFGTLPAQIGQITDLQDLRLDHNNFSGQIPPEIGSLTDLETLRLNDNFWTGTIPNVFQDYARLDFFDASGNKGIEGLIPKTIFDIPSIRLVYMQDCSLTGSIPTQYSNPPLLRDLYLNGNPITGSVPSIEKGKLEGLNELLLHETFITGTMPDSVCKLREKFILDDLWTDCGGENPEIDCPFPNCCNRCFEGIAATTV